MMEFSGLHETHFSETGVYLALQVTLAILELCDAAAALLHHGLLSLYGALKLQVLLTGALTGQSSAPHRLLQN